jgi:hypothetical protein
MLLHTDFLRGLFFHSEHGGDMSFGFRRITQRYILKQNSSRVSLMRTL